MMDCLFDQVGDAALESGWMSVRIAVGQISSQSKRVKVSRRKDLPI